MDVYRSPVARSVFTVRAIKEYGKYILFSEKYKKSFEIHINWLDHNALEKAEVGDMLELPDSMLYEDVGRPIFSNHELSFGVPRDDVAFPKDYNIEEDHAYLTYGKTMKRVLIQRFYG